VLNTKKYCLLLFVLMAVITCAQSDRQKDSLLKAIKNEKTDSLRAKKLILLSTLTSKTDFTTSLQSANEALSIFSRLGNIKRVIQLHILMGDAYYYEASHDRAIDNYYRAYNLSDSIKDDELLASACYNLGWMTALQKGNANDVHLLYKALKIGQQKNFEDITNSVYNALGGFYTDQYTRNKNKALFDSAVKYFTAGIQLNKKRRLSHNSGSYYVNMGQLFHEAKDYTTARYYIEKAKGLAKNDSHLIVSCIHKLSLCDGAELQYNKAIKSLEFLNRYTKRKNLKELECDVLRDLAAYNRILGKHEIAYEYLEAYHKSIKELNDVFMKSSLKSLEAILNYEKSEANVKQLKQDNEIQELKNKRKSLLISVLGVLAGIIILIAYLLFKQNKLKQTTNLQLQKQNRIITEKKLEIEQSIDYAKGIQTVFLPDITLLNSYLPNFIFYKPKDVVSGDFYWFKQGVSSDEIWLACADCTGHGVPGALMSMVGINTLEQLCSNNKEAHPDFILKLLNNSIKDSLKQHKENHKQSDGMDIALLKINKHSKTVAFAAANRPLYLIRDAVLNEIKPEKMAIGGYTPYNQTYQLNTINLKTNDLLVLSTDGYADQFGGPHGKKRMTKNFKIFLEKVSPEPTNQQLKYMEADFESWKGNHNQVDDLCVIGIRIE